MKSWIAAGLAVLWLVLPAHAEETVRYVSGLPSAATSGQIVPVLADQYGRQRIVIDGGVGSLALESGGNLAQLATDFGPPGATACASDTASCNLNQQMQRALQSLTTVISTLGGGIGVMQSTSPWVVSMGPSALSNSGVAPVATSALAANQIIKGSSGNLYSIDVAADSTLAAAAWWVMVYNATSAPSDGAIAPSKCYAMPLGATNFSAAFPMPIFFSTGITVGVSTTGCFTKTASTHAFISGDAQ